MAGLVNPYREPAAMPEEERLEMPPLPMEKRWWFVPFAIAVLIVLMPFIVLHHLVMKLP